MLENGTYSTIAEDRVLRLTLLAPGIVEVILHGRRPAEITLAALMRPFSVVEGATTKFLQLRPIIRSTGDLRSRSRKHCPQHRPAFG